MPTSNVEFGRLIWKVYDMGKRSKELELFEEKNKERMNEST
ncbi:MAG: hypothetical protein WC648_05330 [Candidatus Paceibacterota bacterium]|jgi:hypothetical protein